MNNRRTDAQMTSLTCVLVCLSLLKLSIVVQNVILDNTRIVGPGLDAILHMSRIGFNFELTLCEVRRLNQFQTAN